MSDDKDDKDDKQYIHKFGIEVEAQIVGTHEAIEAAEKDFKDMVKATINQWKKKHKDVIIDRYQVGRVDCG